MSKPKKPPREGLENWHKESALDGIKRKVCPNCRNYFDTGEDSNITFCCKPCKDRHERGEYV